METTATIPTSGSFRLDNTSAAGVVTFTNQTEARVVIPRSTILATSAGEPILFETAGQAILPAGIGQSVDATVQAMDGYSGSVGNVAAGMINTVFGALSENVSVINLASLIGGGDQRVQTVAAEDRERLLDSARIQLQSLAYTKMRAGLSENQIIIIESIQIVEERKEWTVFSADIGTMTTELSLTMRAEISAMVVDERYGRQVALARLRTQIPADKHLLAGSVVFRRGPFHMSKSNGQATFTVSSSARIIATLDRDNVREQLAGLSASEAQVYLASLDALSDDEPFALMLQPQGLERMPTLPIRINIQVHEPT